MELKEPYIVYTDRDGMARFNIFHVIFMDGNDGRTNKTVLRTTLFSFLPYFVSLKCVNPTPCF